MDIKNELIRNEGQMQKYSAAWQNLERGADMTVYQSFSWHCLLAKELLNQNLLSLGAEIFIYSAVSNGAIKIIFPIIVQKFSNKTRWFGRKKGIYFLGHNSWSDYNNMIYDQASDADFRMVINQIRNDFFGFRFVLTDILPNTKFAAFLKRNGATLYKFTSSVSVKSPISEDLYSVALSKHTRQNLRTCLNRMSKDGIRYSIAVSGIVLDDALLSELLNVHVERIAVKNTHDQDLFHMVSSFIRRRIKCYTELHNNIIWNSMKTMNNSVFVISYLNGEVAGYLYGLKDRNVVRIMQNCIREKYSFYSPMFRGAYDYIVSTANDPSIESVDFTRGNEPYKFQLGGSETLLENYRFWELKNEDDSLLSSPVSQNSGE